MSAPTPTIVTLAQCCDALDATLGAAASLATHQSYDELTESINEPPLLQVYWESIAPAGTETDRSTYQAGIRHTALVFHADLYAAHRSGNIGQEMKVALPIADEIVAILEAQDTKPFFGLVGVKTYAWRAERATFEYAGAMYLGIRFVITLGIF